MSVEIRDRALGQVIGEAVELERRAEKPKPHVGMTAPGTTLGYLYAT